MAISRYPVCDGCPPFWLHGVTFPVGSAEQRSAGAAGRLQAPAPVASTAVGTCPPSDWLAGELAPPEPEDGDDPSAGWLDVCAPPPHAAAKNSDRARTHRITTLVIVEL